MRYLRFLAMGTCLTLLLAGRAVAQQDISGTVIDGGTLLPLSLARVSVDNGGQTVITDAKGQFRLAGLSGASVSVTVRRIGYKPHTETVRVGQIDVRIALAAEPAH